MLQVALQLGWAFGPAGAKATVKERLVRPEGFEVSEKAWGVHKISHERAVKDGLPLADVLAEFLTDLLYLVQNKDARLVCHHLEFDLGIITNEMTRCGMEDAKRQLAAIGQKGMCTMDPQIGRWLREAWGEDSGNAEAMNALGLKTLVKKLMPECKEFIKEHHTAGPDAHLHRRLAYALCGLGRAPCRLQGGAHEKHTLPSSDEAGEVEECILCGERF